MKVYVVLINESDQWEPDWCIAAVYATREGAERRAAIERNRAEVEVQDWDVIPGEEAE